VNKAHHVNTDHRHAAKVDREDENFHVKHVALETSRAIQKARQDKGWTQKDLAVVCICLINFI
jgi:putative transcription factor